MPLFSYKGQKQNNFGDSFSSDENFIGELTQFSVFSEVLSDADIIAMASIKSGACELGHQGNAVSWTDVLRNIHGDVTVRNSSWCNGETHVLCLRRDFKQKCDFYLYVFSTLNVTMLPQNACLVYRSFEDLTKVFFVL